jgi:dipeptide/tripeptide permease
VNVQGGRSTASGMLNAASAIAGIISPMVFGLVDATGNWTLDFTCCGCDRILGSWNHHVFSNPA